MNPPPPEITRILEVVSGALGGENRRRRMLVGVSGGRDSMVLLDVLQRLGFQNLVVVHVNHRLRGRDSTADAAFVRRFAANRGIPGFFVRATTPDYATDRGISIELAARELRHAAFASAAAKFRCPRIALAHHADDQVETCLHNYLRGAGAMGLVGMRRRTTISPGPRTLEVLRPLLAVRRIAINDYARAAGLKFRDDASNADPQHTRNRLRNSILPALVDAVGAGVPDAILRTSEILSMEDEFLRALAANAVALTPELPVAALRNQHPAIQRRILHTWLAEFGPPECGFAEVERIRSMLPVGSVVAKVNLPSDCHARRRAGVIFLEG